MKAMILAAGFGKRLQPLTIKKAKPAIPVMNIPLITHNLMFLKKNGIDDAIVNLHYIPESIEKIVDDGSKFGISIKYSYEDRIMGTAGGLKKAEDFLRNSTFLMINSDTLIDFDLQDAIRFHRSSKAVATMVLADFDGRNEFGPVEVDGENRIRNILGKVSGKTESLRRKIFTGVHIFESEIFRFIPADMFYEINTQVYPELIKSGKRVFGYPLSGYWDDVGALRRYLNVHKEVFKSGVYLSCREGNKKRFIAGDNCSIDSEEKNLSFTVLGENCLVGKGVSLNETVVLKNVRIGDNVRISRSILDDGVNIDDGMVIEDSVVYADSRRERKIVRIKD